MGNNLCMVDKSTRGHDVEFDKMVSYTDYLFYILLAKHKTLE